MKKKEKELNNNVNKKAVPEKKRGSKNKKPNLAHRSKIVLDGVLFFILLLAASLSMVLTSSELSASNEYYLNYDESGEFFEDSMQSSLSTTVPNIVYYNSNGHKTEYVGLPVERLIEIDLYIRAYDDIFNESSLEEGIERSVLDVLSFAFDDQQEFLLVASLTNLPELIPGSDAVDGVKLYLSNKQNLPELAASAEPVFTRNLDGLMPDLDNMKTGQVLIEIYLI